MAREQRNIVVQTIGEQIRVGLKFGDTVYCIDADATRTINTRLVESPSTFEDMLLGSGDELLIGDTASRPATPSAGLQYYDTDLVKPIWFNGADWTDSAGTVLV